ncbi:MAG: hypothetical protein K0S76_2433 [Herbinix sp.]|nr:hypothetical protein [Herbinix sp.]
MNKKISTANDICYILMEILMMSVIYLVLQGIVYKGKNLHYLGIPIIILIAAFDYYLKIKCENFIIFLTGHLIFIPVLLYTGLTDLDKISLGALLVILLLGSVQYWKIEILTERKKQLHMSLLSIILFIAAEIICIATKLNNLVTIIACMGIAFLLLYYIRTYFSNMLVFFSLNVDAKNIPFQKIFFMNSSYNCMVMLFSVLFIILASIFNAGNLLIYLWNGLKSLFVSALRLLSTKDISYDVELPESEEEPELPLPDLLDEHYVPKTNPMLDMIIKMLLLVSFICILLLTIFLIYRSLKFYLKRYTPKTGIIEYTETIDSIKTEKEAKRISIASFFQRKTNNQKIRRIYYNRIKYFQKSLVNINANDTPGEIKERIEVKTGHNVHMLTKLYELARYGESELSNEYVEKAKKAKD